MKAAGWMVLGVLFASCIDLELAHADCVDAGRCSLGEDSGTDAGTTDAGVDAGSIDAGGVDAGALDAGVDAGAPDAGAPDAGQPDAGADGGVDAGPPPCPGSTRPRLVCESPINLGGGSSIDFSSLAADPEGFLAAWTSNRVELKRVRFDGGVTPLVSRAGVSSGQVAVDSKGSRWALVWLNTNALSASCVTSDDPDAGQTVSAPGNLEIISAAISVDGGVAIAAKRGPLFLGAQAHGCPSTLASLPFPVGPLGVSVVATSHPLGDGFRYVYTGLGDAGNITEGNVIVGALATGLVTTSYYEVDSKPLQNLAVASSDGANVLVVYEGEGPNLSQFRVSAYGTSADLSGTADPSALITTRRAGWWSIGTCGPGCAVAGTTPLNVVGPAQLTFFSDDSSLAQRREFDLACDLPSFLTESTSLSLGYSGGRLGALITTSAGAQLYLCDVP